jgi:hypothetical protein
MTTPTFFPPTDNLYKFCALLGSIMVITSFYYPILYLNQVSSKIQTANLMIDKNEAIFNFSKDKMKTLLQILNNTIDYQNGKPRPKDKVEILYSNDDLKAMDNEITNLTKELKLSQAEKNYYVDQANFLSSFKWFVIVLMYLLAIVGIFLAGWGYRNWYNKIQIFQDREIKERLGKEQESKGTLM